MFGPSIITNEDLCNTSTSYPKTKTVFKMKIEIDQMVLVEQPADRQEYLCQGQSLNLFFPAGAEKSDLHRTHLPHGSWEQKVCTILELKHLNVQRMLQRRFQEMQLRKDYETQEAMLKRRMRG